MFNVAFLLPWKSFEQSGVISTLFQNLHIEECKQLLNKVPRYEEPKAEEAKQSAAH